MPGSIYLQPDDYANYGVPNATAAQVVQASAIIDGHLKRPEGLIWVPDAAGNPAYMAGLNPLITYNAPAAIQPGTNVVVPVTGGPVTQDLVGQVFVLDRTTSGAIEACVVAAIGAGTITLAAVANAHTAPCSLDQGMQILEELSLPQDRSIARVARWPLIRILSGMGRYSYGRRSNQAEGYVEQFNLLAAVSHYGGPPLWIPFDVTVTSTNITTGEVWVPAGVLLAYYSDVRLWYVAGWSQANLPADIKQACANLVASQAATSGFGPSIKSAKAGESAFVRFGNTIIDGDTVNLLAPYRARLFV